MIIPFIFLTGFTLLDLANIFVFTSTISMSKDGVGVTSRKIFVVFLLIVLVFLILIWIDWIVSLAHGEYPLA